MGRFWELLHFYCRQIHGFSKAQRTPLIRNIVKMHKKKLSVCLKFGLFQFDIITKNKVRDCAKSQHFFCFINSVFLKSLSYPCAWYRFALILLFFNDIDCKSEPFAIFFQNGNIAGAFISECEIGPRNNLFYVKEIIKDDLLCFVLKNQLGKKLMDFLKMH